MLITDIIGPCTDYNFISVLAILRQILKIMQVAVPIILIISAIWGLTKLLINPEEKNGLKGLKNKFIAAIIFIFIPALTTLIMSWSGESLSISACWETAVEYKTQLDAVEDFDVKTEKEEKKNFIQDISDYNFSSSTNSTAIKGNAKGKDIVKYALTFVGKRYVYGGGHGWNGTMEELYASGGAVDCSSFTSLTYKKFGYNISGTTYTQINDGVGVDYSQAQAGDLILYSGHVAIFMGDGDKIVHASHAAPFPVGGIKITDNAKYTTIIGVRRII